MKIGGIGSGEMIKEELKALSIEQGQFEKETFPRPRVHRAVQIETLKAIGAGQQGLNAAGRDTATPDGQQTAATFVLGPEASLGIAVLLDAVYALLQLRTERGLALRHVLGLFFGGERRGALGLACTRYHTPACTVL